MNKTQYPEKRNLIRFTARALAIIFGVLLMFFFMNFLIENLSAKMLLYFKTDFLIIATITLMPLASVLISFKWEAFGGVILIIVSMLLLFGDYYLTSNFGIPHNLFRILFWSGFSFITGILFLISWWKSRTLKISQA